MTQAKIIYKFESPDLIVTMEKISKDCYRVMRTDKKGNYDPRLDWFTFGRPEFAVDKFKDFILQDRFGVKV